MTGRGSSADSRSLTICTRRLASRRGIASEGRCGARGFAHVSATTRITGRRTGGVPMTRILTAADVAALLTIDDCIAAVETAFRNFGEGRIAPPQTLGVHGERG